MISKILEFPASLFARLSIWLAIKRNNLKVVGVTGSTGKTSTKDAIAAVLETKYKVLVSHEEGYNTVFGIPLILFERKSPKNKLGWLFFILISPILALQKRNYDFAILEMGADKPGDIDFLTNLIRPDIAVITDISGVHLLKFKNLENIAAEKGKILSKLQKGGVAILNIDNDYIKKMKLPDGVKKITYGKGSDEIQIVKQEIKDKNSLNIFKVKKGELNIHSVALGEHVLYMFGAAIALGTAMNIDANQIQNALEEFKPVRGRLNLIEGINGSLIIDDTYNANPQSMKNALDVLSLMKAERKIAVLGSMNELGAEEKEAHEKIGHYLGQKCDILVVVGDAAIKYILPAAIGSGYIKRENAHSFMDSLEAGEFLKGLLKKGDVVLLKGSQNKIRVEKAIKIIMKNPEDAPRVLCRQGKEWEKRS